MAGPPQASDGASPCLASGEATSPATYFQKGPATDPAHSEIPGPGAPPGGLEFRDQGPGWRRHRRAFPHLRRMVEAPGSGKASPPLHPRHRFPSFDPDPFAADRRCSEARTSPLPPTPLDLVRGGGGASLRSVRAKPRPPCAARRVRVDPTPAPTEKQSSRIRLASMQWNLADLFELVADSAPEGLALAHGVSGATRTWAELDERTNALARSFARARAGPGKRSRSTPTTGRSGSRRSSPRSRLASSR